MGAYPWGFAGVTPNASDNLPDHGALHGAGAAVHRHGALARRAGARLRRTGAAADRGRPAARPPTPAARSAGRRATTSCPGARHPAPSECDDGPFGRGTGGELRYPVTDPGRRDPAAVGRRRRLGPGPRRGAQRELDAALEDPAGGSRRRSPPARTWPAARRSSLPGDRLLQNSVDWGKQNLADLTQTRGRPADPLDEPGQAVPGAARHGRARAVVRRRLPRLPVDLRHRRRVHGLRRRGARPVRDGRGQPAHAARHLGRPQRPARASSCTRRSPTARSGSGTTRNTKHGSERLQHGRDDQVPEHRRARSGAGPATTRSATRCTTSPSATCRRSTSAWTPTATSGPRARATSSGPGWGRRSSTTPSTTSARCFDLADMARSKGDAATFEWATNLGPQAARARSRPRGGTPTASQYADSLHRPGQRAGSSRSTGSARCRWRPS